MKLKCWKTIAKGGEGNHNYINWGKKFPSTEAIRVEKNYHSDEKKRKWQVLIGERYANSRTITGVRVLKGNFETKPQAIKYAKVIMKKHDKC